MKNPPALRPLAALWEWQESAACRGTDGASFFSPTGERGDARARREQRAKQICSTCHVRKECAAFAAALGERHGTWGGMTDRERVEGVANTARGVG
jgi:WhiB family redox-sensing transcriptional regulator